MQAFRAFLLHCGLVDLGFRGNMFTWNSGVRDLDQKKVSLKKDIRVPFKEPLFLGKWYGVASYFFYTKNKKN